ncbi:recombinase family protein [Dysosmobacter sp.]
MNVAVYARVATKDQLALDSQVRLLTQCAKAHGDDVTQVITEVSKSRNSDRTGIDAVLLLAQKGQIDIVLCMEPTRIGRDWSYVHAVQDTLLQHGVQVKYLANYEYKKGDDNYEGLLLNRDRMRDYLTSYTRR